MKAVPSSVAASLPPPSGNETQRAADARVADLLQWARAEEGRPWEWGVTDCVAVTRRGLTVFLGRDPTPNYPPYHSHREARAILEELGGYEDTLVRHGWRRLRLSWAMPGDVVVQPGGGIGPFTCVGLVLGGSYITGAYRESVMRFPIWEPVGAAYILRLE